MKIFLLGLLLLSCFGTVTASYGQDLAEFLKEYSLAEPAPDSIVSVGDELVKKNDGPRLGLSEDPFAAFSPGPDDLKLPTGERQQAILGTYSPGFEQQKLYGGERGGGGDGDEARIRVKADLIYERLKNSVFFQKIFAEKSLSVVAFSEVFSTEKSRIALVPSTLSVESQIKAMVSLSRGTVVETKRGKFSLPYHLIMVSIKRYDELKQNALDEERQIAHEGFVVLGLEKTNDYHLTHLIFSATTFFPSAYELGVTANKSESCSMQSQVDYWQDPVAFHFCAAWDLIKQSIELNKTKDPSKDVGLARKYLSLKTRAHQEMLLAALSGVETLEKLISDRTILAALMAKAFAPDIDVRQKTVLAEKLRQLPRYLPQIFFTEFMPQWRSVADATQVTKPNLLMSSFLSFYFNEKLRAIIDEMTRLSDEASHAQLDFNVVFKDLGSHMLLFDSMVSTYNTQFLMALIEKRVHFPYSNTENYLRYLKSANPSHEKSLTVFYDFYSRQRRELQTRATQLESEVEKLSDANDKTTLGFHLNRLRRSLEPSQVIFDR